MYLLHRFDFCLSSINNDIKKGEKAYYVSPYLACMAIVISVFSLCLSKPPLLDAFLTGYLQVIQ